MRTRDGMAAEGGPWASPVTGERRRNRGAYARRHLASMARYQSCVCHHSGGEIVALKNIRYINASW